MVFVQTGRKPVVYKFFAKGANSFLNNCGIFKAVFLLIFSRLRASDCALGSIVDRFKRLLNFMIKNVAILLILYILENYLAIFELFLSFNSLLRVLVAITLSDSLKDFSIG